MDFTIIWAPVPSALPMLFYFMVVDIVSGLLCGALAQKLDSKVSFAGMVKKAGILMAVAVCYGLDSALHLEIPLSQVVTGFFVLYEAISILENLGRMGVPLPGALLRTLKVMQQSSEAKIEEVKLPEGERPE